MHTAMRDYISMQIRRGDFDNGEGKDDAKLSRDVTHALPAVGKLARDDLAELVIEYSTRPRHQEANIRSTVR